MSTFDCQRCLERFRGKPVNVDGRGLCRLCANRVLPKCDSCGRVISNVGLRVEGESYHTSCFKCVACEDPIRGSYHIYEVPGIYGIQEPVCARCAKDAFEGQEYYHKAIKGNLRDSIRDAPHVYGRKGLGSNASALSMVSAASASSHLVKQSTQPNGLPIFNSTPELAPPVSQASKTSSLRSQGQRAEIVYVSPGNRALDPPAEEPEEAEDPDLSGEDSSDLMTFQEYSEDEQEETGSPYEEPSLESTRGSQLEVPLEQPPREPTPPPSVAKTSLNSVRSSGSDAASQTEPVAVVGIDPQSLQAFHKFFATDKQSSNPLLDALLNVPRELEMEIHVSPAENKKEVRVDRSPQSGEELPAEKIVEEAPPAGPIESTANESPVGLEFPPFREDPPDLEPGEPPTMNPEDGEAEDPVENAETPAPEFQERTLKIDEAPAEKIVEESPVPRLEFPFLEDRPDLSVTPDPTEALEPGEPPTMPVNSDLKFDPEDEEGGDSHGVDLAAEDVTQAIAVADAVRPPSRNLSMPSWAPLFVPDESDTENAGTKPQDLLAITPPTESPLGMSADDRERLIFNLPILEQPETEPDAVVAISHRPSSQDPFLEDSTSLKSLTNVELDLEADIGDHPPEVSESQTDSVRAPPVMEPEDQPTYSTPRLSIADDGDHLSLLQDSSLPSEAPERPSEDDAYSRHPHPSEVPLIPSGEVKPKKSLPRYMAPSPSQSAPNSFRAPGDTAHPVNLNSQYERQPRKTWLFSTRGRPTMGSRPTLGSQPDSIIDKPSSFSPKFSKFTQKQLYFPAYSYRTLQGIKSAAPPKFEKRATFYWQHPQSNFMPSPISTFMHSPPSFGPTTYVGPPVLSGVPRLTSWVKSGQLAYPVGVPQVYSYIHPEVHTIQPKGTPTSFVFRECDIHSTDGVTCRVKVPMSRVQSQMIT